MIFLFIKGPSKDSGLLGGKQAVEIKKGKVQEWGFSCGLCQKTSGNDLSRPVS